MDKKRTVLLADASEEFRAMLQEAIEQAGEFTVTASTGDGREALRLAAEANAKRAAAERILCELAGDDSE